jgi:hypothetical protein
VEIANEKRFQARSYQRWTWKIDGSMWLSLMAPRKGPKLEVRLYTEGAQFQESHRVLKGAILERLRTPLAEEIETGAS